MLLLLSEFRRVNFDLLYFWSPLRYRVIQYLIVKLSDMVKMIQEGSVVAALSTSIRTSWKVGICNINRALLILNLAPLYIRFYSYMKSLQREIGVTTMFFEKARHNNGSKGLGKRFRPGFFEWVSQKKEDKNRKIGIASFTATIKWNGTLTKYRISAIMRHSALSINQTNIKKTW